MSVLAEKFGTPTVTLEVSGFKDESIPDIKRVLTNELGGRPRVREIAGDNYMSVEEREHPDYNVCDCKHAAFDLIGRIEKIDDDCKVVLHVYQPKTYSIEEDQ